MVVAGVQISLVAPEGIMDKPFLLFKGLQHYPSGGWHDYIDAFASLDAARAAGHSYNTEWGDWYHVVDLRTRNIVFEKKYDTPE